MERHDVSLLSILESSHPKNSHFHKKQKKMFGASKKAKWNEKLKIALSHTVGYAIEENFENGYKRTFFSCQK